MADSNLNKFKKLLAELFMFDQADLDFGIYRIMNAKRDEITRFLDNDLLPQVRQTLEQLQTGDRAGLEAELKKAIEQAQALGVDSDLVPKVRQLREQLAATTDVVALENEVFSDLSSFFRRYYQEGDYLSLRRYKAGVYAIPYEGEEVKLHWANADQYYIKSSEYLRDYTFRLPDERRVHFKLVAADTEQNNNKSISGQERRFILSESDPIVEENGELIIRFEYRPDAGKRKQTELNAEAAERILRNDGFSEWTKALATPAATEKNPKRTLLDKHLADYTARYTFDYFIHKDLGGFLRRELDFYIKNEVMHLDDVESEAAPRVEQYLGKIKAIRRIAHKIIDFLAQLENFQKKLWLKKKFVVATDYCVTLDQVPEELHAEIAANDEQRRDWVRLFAINEIEGNLTTPKYSEPLTVEFLKANPFLVVDTRFFSQQFKHKLLATFDDLDNQIDGLLIHSENFQALGLLQTRYKEDVKCIYIDPPYNTSSSAILYKNDYKHSSWATLMRDRLDALRKTLRNDGAIFVSIDKHERTILEHAMDQVFGSDNHIEELIWAMNTNNSQAPNYSTNHEYVLVYAKDRVIVEQHKDMFREPKPGFDAVMEMIARLNPDYPPVATIEAELRTLYERHKIEIREEIESLGLDWEEEKGNDPWKGLFNYNRAEYRDEEGKYVPEREAKAKKVRIWVWQEGDASMPATKQSPNTRDPNHPNYRFYKPIHPITGRQCPHPKSGWKFAYADDADSPDKLSFVSLDRDHRIAWGIDENKVPRLKRMLHEVETNVGKSVFLDYSDGEKQTSALFGRSGVFLAPKHSNFVSRFIQHSTKKDSIALDCFGGSGSTAHAVINTNQQDRGRRKYILVEVGKHFETTIVPRIQKVVYSTNWRGGKPQNRNTGISQTFKILRLESYEDALNNLELKRTEEQGRLLETYPQMREDYLLSYMLDVESRGSASLLNIDQFEDPFNYKLKVSSDSVSETRAVNVDLVETFNYLLGLRVKHIDTIRGFKVVEGRNPENEKVLIIWRNIKERSNADLDEFFQKQGYNTRDMEFDLIYVNGDNNLENLRKLDETWKVRLIEEEFQRLMFDVQDV